MNSKTERVASSINTTAVEGFVVVQHQATLVRQRIIGLPLVDHHDIITAGNVSTLCRRRGEHRPTVFIRLTYLADLFMWVSPLKMYRIILLFQRKQDFVTRCQTKRGIPYTDLNEPSPIKLDAGSSVSTHSIPLMHINSIVRVYRTLVFVTGLGTMISSEESCHCHVSLRTLKLRTDCTGINTDASSKHGSRVVTSSLSASFLLS